jgi:hypothetical protein
LVHIPKVAEVQLQRAVNQNLVVMADSTVCEHCRLWDRAEASLRHIKDMQRVMDERDADVGFEFMETASLVGGGVQAGVSFRSMRLFMHNRRCASLGFHIDRHDISEALCAVKPMMIARLCALHTNRTD